ncbi:hypothetical protein HN020_18585 [Brevibacillus borstelensis]|uniref:hypothetical protein n=1 Tax=Brevibacillus borstelensis TaxID=45462 RepID=UPI0014903C67|nr:hypothetical protein [Brevibacillus borstelensis]NOU56717.1 hypothetical protein [Brevibacillus borstelensis]
MARWFAFGLLPLLLLLSFVFTPSNVYACTCAEPPTPKKALEQAEAVFAGTVTAVNSAEYGHEVQFQVNTTWKGVSQSQVLVATGSGDGDCGIAFQAGNDYLVYAHPDTYYSESGGLATNICTRTALLSDASGDLLAIGPGTPVTAYPPPLENSQPSDFWEKQENVWIIGLLVSIAAVLVAYLSYVKRKGQ